MTNHLSDSISVVSRKRLEVVQTLQGLDASGVTTTNEPVGVVFASRSQAFVTLDEPDQVLELRFKKGRFQIEPDRIQLGAQAPRALAVAGGKLFVAAFESGNQTEFPSCCARRSARPRREQHLRRGLRVPDARSSSSGPPAIDHLDHLRLRDRTRTSAAG